jgi:RNA polymerase sigma factor (sigma-70 family)
MCSWIYSCRVGGNEVSNQLSWHLLHESEEEGMVSARSSYCPASTSDTLRGNSQAGCEAQLVSAAKRGHEAAFGELWECHAKRIFHTTLRITRNREDAEDALQDSFLSAFVHLRSFDGRSSFSTWLTRIAINSALMKLRRKRSCREVSMDESAGAGDTLPRYELADWHPDPEARYAQGEQQRIVAGAVCNLRPTLRNVVEIGELQEGSMKETARRLGISVAAAKGRLFHARAALRRAPRLRAMRQARVRRAA